MPRLMALPVESRPLCLLALGHRSTGGGLPMGPKKSHPYNKAKFFPHNYPRAHRLQHIGSIEPFG